eukprot:gene14184-19035_t
MISRLFIKSNRNLLIKRKIVTDLSSNVKDVIKLTFVDQEGNRAIVPARVGSTLLDVAQYNKIDLEGGCNGGGGPTEIRRTDKWVESTFGEGPGCFFCHVLIPSTYNSILPELTPDAVYGLSSIWEEEFSPTTSRLACLIKLDKRHDGMVVLVPDAPIVKGLV